jgi:putative two-component system response regulator
MNGKAEILVVDDQPDNLLILEEVLGGEHVVHTAGGGTATLDFFASGKRADLVLLDVIMPEMDGYEVCRRLKADPATAGVPVVFLTARLAGEDEALGFELGAVDYLHKPISPPVVKAHVRTHIALRNAQAQLRDQNALLEERVRERTRELSSIQDVAMTAMATLAEKRDNETGAHIRRTQQYVRVLAQHLAKDPRYAPQLTPETVELIYKSAPLHDIGKVGIPDHILLKPGKLTPAEFTVMKTHAALGAEAIRNAESLLATPVSFLRFAREIAYSHHERWDGSGYPLGLKGEDIPLSARLMALADVYDALINRRVYKAAFPHAYAADYIREQSGLHFDPTVTDAFFALEETFRNIAEQYCDPVEAD